jgi:hypothetical protein
MAPDSTESEPRGAETCTVCIFYAQSAVGRASTFRERLRRPEAFGIAGPRSSQFRSFQPCTSEDLGRGTWTAVGALRSRVGIVMGISGSAGATRDLNLKPCPKSIALGGRRACHSLYSLGPLLTSACLDGVHLRGDANRGPSLSAERRARAPPLLRTPPGAPCEVHARKGTYISPSYPFASWSRGGAQPDQAQVGPSRQMRPSVGRIMAERGLTERRRHCPREEEG